MMSDDDIMMKQTLQYMHDKHVKEPRDTIMAEDLARELNMDENDARGYLVRLFQRNWINNPYKEKDLYAITDLGIKQLETIYNPEYMENLAKQELEEKKQKNDTLKREASTLKYTKIGVVSSIGLGAIGLVIAIIALLK